MKTSAAVILAVLISATQLWAHERRSQPAGNFKFRIGGCHYRYPQLPRR